MGKLQSSNYYAYKGSTNKFKFMFLSLQKDGKASYQKKSDSIITLG